MFDFGIIVDNNLCSGVRTFSTNWLEKLADLERGLSSRSQAEFFLYSFDLQSISTVTNPQQADE